MEQERNHPIEARPATTFELVFGKVLLIFQMPKTGSQTVEASLGQCRLPHRIVRCHYVSAVRQAELRRSLEGPHGADLWKQQVSQQLVVMRRLAAALRIRTLLRRSRLPIPKLEIITAVREPVGLGVSSVFQNWAYFVSAPEQLTAERCREILQGGKLLPSIHNWFDQELLPVTGLDVYSRPFPRQRGYAVYENAVARVLLYRFESLDRLGAMLGEFFGCENPEIVNCNLSSAKSYAEHYARARQQLGLPADFLRAEYRHKMVRHFYSEQERAGFVARWTRGSAVGARPAEHYASAA